MTRSSRSGSGRITRHHYATKGSGRKLSVPNFIVDLKGGGVMNEKARLKFTSARVTTKDARYLNMVNFCLP